MRVLSSKYRVSLAVAALATLGVRGTGLANTWTGGYDNEWDRPENWSSGIPQLTDDVLFPAGLPVTVSLAGQDTANSFTFADNDLLLGASLSLGSGNITVASGVTVGIASAINAPNGLNLVENNSAFPSIEGGGTLVLGNYTGDTFFNNTGLVLNAAYGTVQLVGGSGANIGGISNIGPLGHVQIDSYNPNLIYEGGPGNNTGNLGLVNTGSGFFDLNGHSIAFDRLTGSGFVINSSKAPSQITLGGNGGSSTFAGTFLSGSVTLQKVGAGTLTIEGGVSNSGLNLVVNQGTVMLNFNPRSNTDFAVGPNGVTINGGTLVLARGSQLPPTAPITMNGGIFDIHGTGTAINGLDGAAGTVTNNGPTLKDGYLTLLNTTTHAYSGTIADGTAGPLSLITGFPSGVSQILNGHNTFTGATRILDGNSSEPGTLEIGPSGSLGGGLVELITHPDAPSLRLDNPQALPPSTVLQIDDLDTENAPKFGVELNFEGTDYISGFTLTNGTNLLPVAQPLGIYNAQTDPQFFSGPGSIVVTPEPLSGAICCVAVAGLFLRRRRYS